MYVLLFLPYEVSNSFALWNAVKGALGRVWCRATIKGFLLVVCLAGYVKYSPSTTILLNTTDRIVYYRYITYKLHLRVLAFYTFKSTFCFSFFIPMLPPLLSQYEHNIRGSDKSNVSRESFIIRQSPPRIQTQTIATLIQLLIYSYRTVTESGPLQT